MSSLAVVTVVTRNYVPYARALAMSVKEHEPQTPFWVCLADDPGPEFQPPAEWDHWFLARDLKIPAWRRFAFQYTPFELSCALKSFAIQHLFEQGYERAAYLDGDMQVYSPLTDLHRWLDDASIVITPHDHRARTGATSSQERLFMMAGAFNAGFLALRRGTVASDFLAWWQARVAKDCVRDLLGGMFVDQKWLDHVPGIFSEVHIVRHLGYNVGHWTLAQAPCTRAENGGVFVGGYPLTIFHYSGFVPTQPDVVSCFAPQQTTAAIPALKEACQVYAERLRGCARQALAPTTCEFDTLSDGTPINSLWREAIRSNHAALADIDDPFDASQTPPLVPRFRQVERDVKHNRQDWRRQSRLGPLRRAGKYLEDVFRQWRKRRAA